VAAAADGSGGHGAWAVNRLGGEFVVVGSVLGEGFFDEVGDGESALAGAVAYFVA